MGKLSRRKGKTWERAIARAMRTIFGDQQIKRGNQTRFGSDGADVDGSPYWVEAKHEKRFDWRAAMRQAKEATDGRTVVVVGKEDLPPPGWRVGEPKTPPVAVMQFDDWVRLVGELHFLRDPKHVDEAVADGRLLTSEQVSERCGSMFETFVARDALPKPFIRRESVVYYLRSDVDDLLDFEVDDVAGDEAA